MHSPYQTTVHAAIDDLDSYRSALHRIQASMDDGERDKYRDQELMDLAEPLLEQCDFLEEKLDIKRREYNKLHREHDALQEEVEGLKTENESLKTENEALKEELAALKEGGKTRGEAGNGEDTSQEAGKSDNPRKRRAADSDILAEGGKGKAAKKAKGG